MPELKLKFKIELSEKIQKLVPSQNQSSSFEEFQANKFPLNNNEHLKHNPISSPNNNYSFITNNYLSFSKSKFPPYSKYSIRSSKAFINDIDPTQLYESMISNLPSEEKEQIITMLKSFDNTSLYYIFTLITSHHLYQKLKTKQGLEILKNIYNDLLSKNKPKNKTNNGLNEINDECELYILLKDIMNLNDIDSCQIFNIFKYNDFFSMNITHFILMIYFFLAYECKEIDDYIQSFGDDLYNAISGNDNYITVSRMKMIGNLVGIKEKEMNSVLMELNYSMYSEINNARFKEFYVKIGKKLKGTSTVSTPQMGNFVKTNQNAKSSSVNEKSNISLNYGKFHFKRK